MQESVDLNMSELQASSSQLNQSYLEDSGIFLGTKQNQPLVSSLKPPRIVSKIFSSTPLCHAPRCVAGIKHTNGIFPISLYDDRCDQSYLNQCYEILNKLGEGSFGTVLKVRSKHDGKLYAVKVFKESFRNRAHRAELLQEVKRHEQLSNHPNIVSLYQAWEDEGCLYILLELCETSLDIYTQNHHNISESMVWDILLDTVSAVKYIHDRNLIHMDIKLENILKSSEGVFKLSDFGLVLDASKSRKDGLEGDPKYLAPEVMEGVFTQAADIFSLGIAILEVASDIVLPGQGEAWHHLRQGKIPQQQTARLSPELVDVIMKMMHPDPRQRLTADEILKTPKLRRRVWFREWKKMFQEVQTVGKSYLSVLFSPIRRMWQKIMRMFSRKSRIAIKKCSSSPIQRPGGLDVRYAGIGHSTPMECNGDNSFLNLSNYSPCSITKSHDNLIRSRQQRYVSNPKKLFAKRKLYYNFSDDSE